DHPQGAIDWSSSGSIIRHGKPNQKAKSMQASNLRVGIAIATALAGALGAPSGVFARSRWEQVIAPAARGGRARLAPAASDIGGQRETRDVEKARPSPSAAARATAASDSAPAYSHREDRDSGAADHPRVSSRMQEHAAGDRLREALAAA